MQRSERRAPSPLRVAVALAAFVALAPACKKTAEKPDASVGPTVIADEDLGFELQLSPEWILARDAAPTDAGPPADAAAAPVHVGLERLAEARRQPPRGRSYLVQPKLVITAEPTTQPDVEAVVRTTANDLRGLERAGARIGRSAQATRLFGDVEVGDLELAYAVGEKKETAREVVQRTLVTLRTRADGTSAVWTLTVTYLTEDAEQLTADVQQLLATLRFKSRAAAVAPADGGTR